MLQLTGTPDGSQSYDQTSIGLTITNHSGHTVDIQRGISIEQSGKFKWAPLMAIQAVSACGDYDPHPNWHAAVRLEDRGYLDVMAWDGATCGGQCRNACQENAHIGGGTYRFVVITREGARILSPEFKIPSP